MWKSISLVGIESGAGKVKLPPVYLQSANSLINSGTIVLHTSLSTLFCGFMSLVCNHHPGFKMRHAVYCLNALYSVPMWLLKSREFAVLWLLIHSSISLRHAGTWIFFCRQTPLDKYESKNTLWVKDFSLRSVRKLKG